MDQRWIVREEGVDITRLEEGGELLSTGLEVRRCGECREVFGRDVGECTVVVTLFRAAATIILVLFWSGCVGGDGFRILGWIDSGKKRVGFPGVS